MIIGPFDLYWRLETMETVSEYYTWDKPFNYSQINNDAVRLAKGRNHSLSQQ